MAGKREEQYIIRAYRIFNQLTKPPPVPQSKLVSHQTKFDVTSRPFSENAPLESSIIPPPFLWEKQNYLLKILNDFSFFSVSEIFEQWLGLDPTANAFFVPTADIDVGFNISRRKARMTHDIRKRRETAAKARATELRKRMTVGVVRKKVNVISAFVKAGSGTKSLIIPTKFAKGTKAGSRSPRPGSNSPKRSTRRSLERGIRKSLSPAGIAKTMQVDIDYDESIRKSPNPSPSRSSATFAATTFAGRDATDLNAIRDNVMNSLAMDAMGGSAGSPKSPKPPSRATESSEREGSSSDSDSDHLSSGEEQEVTFPDVIPQIQIINPLPSRLLERCRGALNTIAEERRFDFMRLQKKQELEDFRNTNFHSYRPNTASVDGDGVLGRCTVDKASLMSRSTYARPSTADFSYGFPGVLEDDSRDTGFFLTQADRTTGGVEGGQKLSLSSSYSRILTSPARQKRALQNSLAMRGTFSTSKLNNVFVSNPARFAESPFPMPVAGKMLVNSEASQVGLFHKYNTAQATVIVQSFGRFILARYRMQQIREFRKISKAASLIQRIWRGRKGRTDFLQKFQSKKAGELRERIEAREIQKAAAVLQKFFDNIRASALEKQEAANRERRRVQEKLWMRKAMLDAAAFQLQRVYRRYLSAKREWEQDYEIKFQAATTMQGGVRIRLARKKIEATKKSQRATMRQKIMPTKMEPAAEYRRALITLQCWARVCIALVRTKKKRAKREKQLWEKLKGVKNANDGNGYYNGAMHELEATPFEDDASMVSSTVASITLLMGAVAATEAASLAEAYTDADVEEGEEERRKRLAEEERARPGSRKGASARRNIHVN